MSSADSRSANSLIALLLIVSLQAACGYIGGPLAPLANVPARILDLAALQRGNTIVAQFTIPTTTTEHITIKEPLNLDLRIGAGVNPFNADRWAEQAKQVPSPKASSSISR